MRILVFLMILAFSAIADEVSRDDMISIKKFEIASPVSGNYAPWRDHKDASNWYSGELIAITNSTFRYSGFSDVIDSERPAPDYSGKISIFEDHVYLNHPGIAYPYRVSGLADGIPVLLTWEGYEQWKRKKRVFPYNILYLEKTPGKKK